VWEQKIGANDVKLALTLLMTWICTDHTYHTFTTNNFTVTADFFY